MSSPQSSAIKFALGLTFGVVAVGLMLTQSNLSAQTAPNLGSAAQFALLGNSAVTGSAGAGTVVSGSVGSFPTSTISNFPPSTVTAGHTLHLTANATVQQAQTDARAAYAFLAAQGGTPIAGDNLNTTLTPGVYSLGAANLPASTTLTLNGSGIFIFNVASTLVMNASSSVIGSANPCNVYWRVGTSATLSGTSFMGTVLADASITVGPGNVTGRLLSGMGATGATTLSVGGNTVGGCSQPTAAPTITKAFNPTSILPGATSQLTITLTNTNSGSSTLTAPFTDTLPTGVLVAATPGAATTCGGAVSATPGGSTVSLGTGSLIPVGSCTIVVNVTAAVPGSYLNTIPVGALQTSLGNNTAPASATLSVTCPVITLSPTVLPGGTVGVAYAQTIAGSGGTAPYTYALVSGTLPAGVTLSSAGVLAGTPTAAGTSPVTIRGTDANNCTADLVATIVIAAAPIPPPVCPVITLAPSPLPNGTVGAAYSQVLTGSGGTAPYSFGVTAGTLPAGLTLTGAGLLAGTPTAAGSITFTIRGTDANNCFAEVVSTLVIAAAPIPPPVCPVITLAPSPLPNGTVGAAYSQAITGSGGTAPYTFGVTAGTLPAGLTLTAAGLLAGTPTTAGSTTFTIRGTDANNCFVEVVSTLVIAAAPIPPPVCPVITLAPSPLPNGTVGVAYSQAITGSGGTAPYTFGVTAGTLPAGLTLTAAGLLAGTPTAAGSTTFTIRGTDANGCFAEVVSTLVIAAAPIPPPVCPVITLSPATITNGLVGTPFSQTLIASGGTAPYTFGIITGALPTGIALTMTGGLGLLSGTPTTNGSYAFTVRVTDSLGCLAERSYVVVITTSVPTMPEIFVLLLAVLLTTMGYVHLRRS